MLETDHSIVHIESMPSSWSPGNLWVIETFQSNIGLSGAGQDMSLFQSIKFAFFGICKDLMRNFIDIFRSQNTCIDLSNSGDNFSLLSLIVKNRDLFSFLIFELLPKERVASSNCNDFSKLTIDDVIDVRSGHQHCCIWNFFGALPGIFSIFWYNMILHQHVPPWNH